MQENNKMKRKNLRIISICFIALLLVFLPIKVNATEEDVASTNDKLIYLSDISARKAQSGYGSIFYNQYNGNLLNVKLNGTTTSFEKGIFAHATSILEYDLSNYDYDYFVTYVGINSTGRTGVSSVKFYVYTSMDGINWELITDVNPPVITLSRDAQFLELNIKGAKYLKLEANADGGNGSDHAVWVDAKLLKESYFESTIKRVEEYDKLLEEQHKLHGYDTEKYELTLLQREFVSTVGYHTLQEFIKTSDVNREMLSWLMNDSENLRLYLVGGKPEGSYLNSLKVLSKLYAAHKEDLSNETVTKYGTPLKDLYRRMMLSISLTHSGTVYLWIRYMVSDSDPVMRYEIYKKLHLHEGQEQELIENKIFESLTVEEMRWVMNTVIDDEEIEWLNSYTRNDKNGATGPYSYIRYTFGYNYNLDKYYDPANYAEWDKKYHLSDYNIRYEKGYPKLWIVFEEGSVCGGLSKTGCCVWGSYKGLPNTCVSQPGHCAYIMYNQDANGNGIWGLGNNVSGWGLSGRTEHLGIRNMNDWGVGSYTTGYNASYILLGQAAQNEYEKYEKAEEILMLTKLYNNDQAKLEQIYRKALEAEKLNFDAWLGLVNLYKNDTTKTEQNYYALAQEIAEVYTYYPQPMYDLLNLLKPHMISSEYETIFKLLLNRTLTTATKATNAQSIQASAVKEVANHLLGNTDTTVATFSFDGENAGQIVLADFFQDTEVQWDYSLQGGAEGTWIQTDEHKRQLTAEELASITSENDIKVHIIGVDYSDNNILTIDIQKAVTPTSLYNNDLENRVIGASNTMEWKLNTDDPWTSFATKLPDLTGDKTVTVRIGATGQYLPSDSVNLSYTEDNQPDTRKYIPVSHLSVHGVSSEATSNGGHAKNAIDANINTIWHTNWNGGDSDRFITIKLDEPKYLSAFEYVPRQSGTNGRLNNGKLLVSMDGENWTEAATITGWANNAVTKVINLDEPIQVQYIKLQATTNHGDGRTFLTAAMINLFEDTTKIDDLESENPTPEEPVPEEPTPEIPVPEEPTPEIPVPEEPTPENPVPEEPTPEIPVPEELTPEIPEPEEPILENPVPENPTPENPEPEEPTPENSEPEEPTPEIPVPEEPTPEVPVPDEPTPEIPAPEEPIPENPVPEKPTPENPVPEEPTPEIPVPEEPTPEVPTQEETTLDNDASDNKKKSNLNIEKNTSKLKDNASNHDDNTMRKRNIASYRND